MHTTDKNWLHTLDQQTAVLVPTRSLANTLNEHIAADHIAQGHTVWETATILVWPDYLRLLWQSNRDLLSHELGINNLISPQQSLLLWTQVIEASRRHENELMLLNVQQTVRAVQRSWRLMQDWQLNAAQIRQDHVTDTAQFLTWLADYQSLLNKRSLIDEPMLLNTLCAGQTINYPCKKLIWYAYDLVTAAQQKLNQLALKAGVLIDEFGPYTSTPYTSGPHTTEGDTEGSINYLVYPDIKSELKGVLQHARTLLEQDTTTTINIIVPDLQIRYSQISELARDVFYPAASPLQVQQNNTAYRFSLGQAMSDWAAIETALSVITLLNNHTTINDISFLLRNQFLKLSNELKEECRLFDRWLKHQRMRSVLLDSLPDLYKQCLEHYSHRESHHTITPEQSQLQTTLQKLVEQRQNLQHRLTTARADNNFAALSFTEWVSVFSQWLDAWGWHTGTADIELNTVQHQLHQRWISLLQEFGGLASVQQRAGLKRAIELLHQMARDAVFLPKAVASPIVISSILEAIGRPAEVCFLTGMSHTFPPVPRNDAFVPARLLAGSGHPDTTPQLSFQQAAKVNQSLLHSARNTLVSYAKFDDQNSEVSNQVSPLYRHESFVDVIANTHMFTPMQPPTPLPTELESYIDTQGSPWPDASRVRGGSKLFENQSNCAFKAFVTHQLGYEREDEAEFGLDGMDRGNVVHHLLEIVWGILGSQQILLSKNESEIETIIHAAIDQVMTDSALGLNTDKRALLQLERPRLLALLKDWLQLEGNRPENFSVVECEESRMGEFAGIKFKYTIDRLDMTDDGRSLIIDYKTGAANRNDWTGERIKRPQMPLYAVALDNIRNTSVSGIAYARVNQTRPEFVELCEANVFRNSRAGLIYEQQWLEHRKQWENIFIKLAEDFLAGKAEVNPIDEDACRFCDLHAVCRISQLQNAQSSDITGALNGQ